MLIISIFLSGFALGSALVNLVYIIYFRIESRKERKCCKDSPNNCRES